MASVTKEQIAAAKQMSAIEFLQRYRAADLVPSAARGEYQLKSHDSFKIKPCTHHADLLRKVAGLCNNANQLAHVVNATGYADQTSVEEMTRIARQVWEEVKENW